MSPLVPQTDEGDHDGVDGEQWAEASGALPVLPCSSMSYLILLLVGASIAGAAYGVSRVATAWSIGLATRRGVVAEVNERSSHDAPVARVGGIGMMAGVCVGLALLAVSMALGDAMPDRLWLRIIQGHVYTPTWPQFAGIAAGLAVAFALGLWDDSHDPPAMAKLGLQALAALVPPLCGFRIDLLLMPGATEGIVLHPVVGIALTAAWLMMMMNVVNFMDGINGIAGRFAQVAACGMLVGAITFAGSAPLLILCAALWGSAEGFLRHNIPQARTFMGDCGSQPLGLLLGLLAVLVSRQSSTYALPLIGPVIVLSPFIFDVVYTLARRSMRGENLLRAHREHLYQRHLIATGGDHGRTLSFVETHLWVAGIAGAAYIYFGWNAANLSLQLIALAAMAGNLGWYAWGVFSAEAARKKDS